MKKLLDKDNNKADENTATTAELYDNNSDYENAKYD